MQLGTALYLTRLQSLVDGMRGGKTPAQKLVLPKRNLQGAMQGVRDVERILLKLFQV